LAPALDVKKRATSRRRRNVASDRQSSDVERITGELRASIRRARVPRPPATVSRITIPVGAFETDGAIELELAVLRSTYDVAGAPFTTHRKVLGRFIVYCKNIARELLVQLLARQSAYNGAAVRALTNLKHRLDMLAEEQRHIMRRIAALETRFGAGPPPTLPQQVLPQQAGTSRSSEPTGAFGTSRLSERLDALEKAAAEYQIGVRRNA
jgi:hypothetical protein